VFSEIIFHRIKNMIGEVLMNGINNTKKETSEKVSLCNWIDEPLEN
jgi:hypothetical protein